jgi:hypothetical protein
MIKASFNAKDVEKMLKAKIAGMLKAVEAQLIRIGNEFVIDARLKADFTDRTGNLRSSIGYIVTLNGEIITQDFEPANKGTDKVTGELTGQSLAMSVADDFVSGYALIVVAGMEYAAAVESMGKDVLTGSSLQAVASLNKHFKKN